VWDLVTEFPWWISPEILLRQTHTVISAWIYQCDIYHSPCTLDKTTYLPKRILQLLSDTVRVRENTQLCAPYACLSHCWGKTGPDVKLTSETTEDLREGVSISHLPKTFRDAVRICQSLQISFLWIDALCELTSTRSNMSQLLMAMPQVSHKMICKTGKRQQRKWRLSTKMLL
jgi:hypothetical protein